MASAGLFVYSFGETAGAAGSRMAFSIYLRQKSSRVKRGQRLRVELKSA